MKALCWSAIVVIATNVDWQTYCAKEVNYQTVDCVAYRNIVSNMTPTPTREFL